MSAVYIVRFLRDQGQDEELLNIDDKEPEHLKRKRLMTQLALELQTACDDGALVGMFQVVDCVLEEELK